ncbi:hypothetical protein H0H93_015988 [Arthromyces matolae]|nr:hypothetical protein H0H93_015988 [Arthromyces matolae]
MFRVVTCCHTLMVHLPNFLVPILSYIHDVLPSPIYSFLINAVSHLLVLGSAAYDLVVSLLSRHPFDWDLQTVLPPLITLFAAYLALLSFYRTTTWMLRTTFFFVKWGTLIAIFIASIAWFTGNGGTPSNYGGVVSTLGNAILAAMNGQTKKPARRWSHKQSSRPRASSPKAWDSFQRHRDWNRAEPQGDAAALNAQNFINDIVGAADRLANQGGWWELIKAVGNKGSDTADADASQQTQSKAGSSRSR